MKRIFVSIIVLALAFATGCPKNEPEAPEVNAPKKLQCGPKAYMSTEVNITILIPDDMSRDDAKKACEAAFAMIGEVEQHTSNYIAGNDVWHLNHREPWETEKKDDQDEQTTQPAEPDFGVNFTLAVNEHTYNVVKRANEISKATEGVFDITTAPLVKLWRDFAEEMSKPKTAEDAGEADSEGVEAEKADPLEAIKEEANNMAAKVGYRNVICTTVKEGEKIIGWEITLKNGVQIDLGGLAKGYAVDKAVEVLNAADIKAGFVEAGGDVRVFGEHPEYQGWPVAIRNYAGKSEAMDKFYPLNKAVATSGEYERGFTYKGNRYSHIIDPRTGCPVETYSSVSVMAKDCMTADALATAISILGPEEAQKVVDAYKEKNKKTLCEFMVVWPTKGWVETSRN